ncbi:NEAT domain-containing protein [Levilactobacillus enshiensis]|uniref:NEAT domain-containing protein n=1 Tax=Levilactobacillus enshiensis TaxID=2590213 RepID=UPI00117A4122|nr:NEAT domain-containing protein [Levilactobacillus enshiensis]
MKKSLTVMSALLMLSGVGAGIPLSQAVTPTQQVQAAALNPAKLANGTYTVSFNIFKTGTTTASEAAGYFNPEAKVTVKDQQATVTLTATAAAANYIDGLTLGKQTAKVTKAATGNTYTFSDVDLTANQVLGFKLTVPMNGKDVTMQESATLAFKTGTLKATSKPATTTKKTTKAKAKVKLSTKTVKNKAKKIHGTTTKGAKVTVKRGKTTLGKVTTKKAAYTVKLKKAVKKNWKLKVTATKAGYKTVTKTVIVK